MDRCAECGCRRLHAGRFWPIRLPYSSVDVRVPARQCDDCGRTFPEERYLAALFAPMDAQTAPG